MKFPTVFWALCAATLFGLFLLSVHLQLQRKNILFMAWLGASLAFQFLAAIALAMPQRPEWFGAAGKISAIATAILAAGTALLAATRLACPVNQALLMAFAAMLVFDAAPYVLSYLKFEISNSGYAWLRNVSFYGPALYLILVFGGSRLDRLPVKAILDFGFRIPNAAAGWARAIWG
jgi:hypothetical protein